MDKAIFLDRDGTINKEIDYLYKPEDLVLIPGTIEAINIFHKLDYKVIVITNQAGVARGYYKEEDVEILHKYIDSILISKGTYIDSYYYCPHHPEGIIEEYKLKCNCRKPNIGMIARGKEEFNIDLSESVIVGDKEIDIQTGKKAGIGKCILVKSGHHVEVDKTDADSIFDCLYDFAKKLKRDLKY